MAIRNPTELAAELPAGARLLGLDIGDKTIGLALSDTTLTVASPLLTIARRRFADDANQLLDLVAKHGVGGLVLGLPINMDGGEGPRCQSVRAFARNLLSKRDLPIVFWDERLSTMAVTRSMIAGDLSRRRRAQLVDKAAAAYILQGFLDHLKSHRRDA